MLHPKQFQVNEAWIAFRLNDEAMRTEGEEAFNCICLMDAASCFILGNAFVAVHDSEPSQQEARRLLEAGWAHKQQYASTLFLPTGQFQTHLRAEAERQGISVVSVSENQLLIYSGEARQAFRQYFERGDSVE